MGSEMCIIDIKKIEVKVCSPVAIQMKDAVFQAIHSETNHLRTQSPIGQVRVTGKPNVHLETEVESRFGRETPETPIAVDGLIDPFRVEP